MTLWIELFLLLAITGFYVGLSLFCVAYIVRQIFWKRS